MDILENTAKPKFLIAPLLNLAHAKMAENVLIILHITLANVNLDLLAKIVQQISMIAWIICARYVFFCFKMGLTNLDKLNIARLYYIEIIQFHEFFKCTHIFSEWCHLHGRNQRIYLQMPN